MTRDNSIPDIDDLLVVGIGASAGGLDAFTELLGHLPADTGMAFVLVQHLAPDQNSMLEELLNRITAIAVVQAEDGMTVAANQIYVIPPGAQMTIAQGQLQLAKRRAGAQHGKTIDTFLCSLAADRKNKAIAVILSGSNDDGAAGIREICEQGGITFAQDRATTMFPIMPNAAIATGRVDFVLSPKQIAAELINISRHPYVREPATSDADTKTRFEDGELDPIFALLRKHAGVNFAHYKRKTFERRMRRRMALNKLSALSDYIELLESSPSEVQTLYQDVLITVTNFFRDPETFAALKETVFAEILQRPATQDHIRIWVAGCSTGEEVYSVAICLLECLDAMSISPTIQIFGTDVNEQAINEARAGQYLPARLEGVSPERRQRFFSEVDEVFYVNQSVRELCVFARHDLSNDPPFSDIDLVTCRNVLIYFQPHLQTHVLNVFHYSLKPNGFLLLGNSETVGEAANLFAGVSGPHKVFKRVAGPSQISFEFATKFLQPSAAPERSPSLTAALNRSNVQQWADQIVLNRYAPVGVIITEQLEILQFRGDTSDFLRPPAGEPSFNLLKMVRPGLVNETRAAIEEAKQRGVAAKRQYLQSTEDNLYNVMLEVMPFNVAQGRCFLVLFEYELAAPTAPVSPPAQAASPPPPAPEAEVAQLRHTVAALRQELLDTQTFLRMTVEEQEATRQQLVAANEEVLSSNEELRSTNEELQTAKEEIQSANEELQTTNEELQSRNEEWQRANDDLLNLVNNVNIPVLMLSGELDIRSFSPAARQVFNLIPSDVGRPISNLRPNVELPELERLVQDVMETLHTIEQEVQDRDGRWYLLRVRPYRTLENRIDGAVLALINIDTLRRTEEELRASQVQLERELAVTNQMRLLSLQLFSSLDLESALNEVLTAAIALLQADTGSVQLYDPERQVLVLEAQSGFSADAVEVLAEVPATASLACGRALQSKRRILIEDVQSEPDLALDQAIMDTAGWRAVQATPLLNRRGEVLGVLSTHCRQPHRPGDRELQLLDIYARQASEFIELVRAERERQRLVAREQAALAENASKDQFLSVLSHELRTPLNSILGWTQLLEQGQLSAADGERAIATIHNSAQVQLQLIEDLLDASRIIQNRFEIQRQPTNLTALLEQAIAFMRPQAEQKNLHLDRDLAPSPELVAVDTHRLEQVLHNLLGNAVKFTPEGGRIGVRLTYTDAHITVAISDTGVGIDPDFLPHIFDRFRQADTTNTRRTSGLGLGLFLISSIVEAHGGTVQADSPGMGQGSTFTVTLPRIAAEPATAPEPTSAVPTLPNLAGLRLLIVDDDETNIELYAYYLRDVGATTITAHSAAEALTRLEQESVDLILSDIGLPVMNGYDFLRAVRARPADQGGNIPAIALSGYAAQNDIQACYDAGFQRHLAKPVDLDELAIAIHRLTHR